MKLTLILLFCLPLLFGQNRWEKLNGPEGGKISAIITKGDTIVVGVGIDKALIFYSLNKGLTWIKADFKISKYGGSRVSDFIFNRDNSIIASTHNGIYKSFNLYNWVDILSNNEEFWSLGTDFEQVVYAGANNGKIFKSTDFGAHWVLMISGSSYRIENFLEVDWVLYAGTYLKILKKNKNSEIWESINVPSVNSIKLFTDSSRTIFAYDPNKLFQYSDLNSNWIILDTNKFFKGNFVYSMISNKEKIIAACKDETGLFGSGWGIAISDDNGLTWRWSNKGLPLKFSGVFRLAKSDNDIYAGTIGAGLFKSSDLGDSWSPVNNGIYAADTWIINFDDDENLYSSSWSNNISKSSDKGLSWTVINKGFNNSYYYSVLPVNNVILASTSEGLYRSNDKGENWIMISNDFYNSLYKDKYNRLYGMRYGYGLYRSTDLGDSWIRLDNGFDSGVIYGFCIDSISNIYAGTNVGSIFRSSDDGFSWSRVYQSSSTMMGISNISTAPNGTLFAGNIYEGILRSTDGGLNWILKKSDAGYQDAYALGINRKGEIFISGSNSKFFTSTDNAETWKDITDNLKYTSVRDIKFDKEDNMFLATDESVWRSNPDYPVNIKEDIKLVFNYSLEQNYPNPFNPSTSIKYSLKQREFVMLDVFDVLGNKVSSLLNEQKDAGTYEVSWNASKYSSGIYFYQLKVGSFIETRKMLLIK